MSFWRFSSYLAFVFLLLSQTACSLLVGNIKPLEEKSETYGVMDLSKGNPEWLRLAPDESSSDSGTSKGVTPTEIADVAYQARKTGSIISLNSACRSPSSETKPEEHDLKAMTQVLFLGITELDVQTQQPIEIQGSPALESRVQGKLNGEEMMLKTVVLQRGRCVYDLVYMARPRFYEQNEKDFAHFVASLRLK